MKSKNKAISSSLDALIIGPNGPTHKKLIRGLRSKKLKVAWLNADDFLYQNSLLIEDNWLKLGSQGWDLSQLKIVWLTLPHWYYTSQYDLSRLTPKQRLFVRRWQTAMSSIVSFAQIIAPADHTILLESAQNKFGDLKLAQRIGFATPKTTMTNHLELSVKYFEKHKIKKVVIKDFSSRVVDTIKDLKNLKLLKISQLTKHFSAPVVVQEFVEKKSEVRAVVAYGKCWAVESPNLSSQVDGRVLTNSKPQPVVLPKLTQQKLLKLAQLRKLKIVSVDLVRSVDNQLFFLEMNRPGNWGGVDKLYKGEISQHIVTTLARLVT